MLLGPIFQAELLRTARRPRYYVLRLVYGLILLFVIWASYQGATADKATVTIDEAAEFALQTFLTFAIIQLIGILLLIPALFGGAIADEKQRKTLHYLMASRLSGAEIVLDKVLGRVPHLAVFLAMGLPVVCLLGLIGGVPPEYVAVAYVGTASTATMAVALTVLVSTLTRKVRQAVLVAYILLLGWQIVPVVILALGRGRIVLLPVLYGWVEPINDWIGATTPLYVWATAMMRTGGRVRTSSGLESVVWMVGLQLASSVVFLTLAVWQLRPAFRRHEATQPRRKWFERRQAAKARPRRWYDRPECGGDAVGWKERHFARTDIFTKLFVLPATVMVSVFLFLYVGIDETLWEALAHIGRGRQGDAETFVQHIRVVTAWYVAIWLLAVAGASASSVAVEREEDTWITLTSTPLSGWEILRGKALGAIWAQRGFAAFPLGLWTIGLVTGAVHPLGYLATLATFAIVTALVAAVGLYASLRAATTSKAITSTIVTLVVLYGYPLFIFLAILGRGNGAESLLTVLGLPPRLVIFPLATHDYYAQAWGQVMPAGWISPLGYSLLDGWISPVAFYLSLALTTLMFYATLAAALTQRCVLRFDRWLDRPALAADRRTDRKSVTFVEIGPALQS